MTEALFAVLFIGVGALFGALLTSLYRSDKIIDAEFDKRFYQMEAIKYKSMKDNLEKKYFKLLEKTTGGEQDD